MSRSAEVRNVPIGGGRYTLCLRMGQLDELQEICKAGPDVVLNRLRYGQWFTYDLVHTIRLALQGGGMPETQATPLVERYVKEGYLQDYLPVAAAVLFAAISGDEDDPVGEPLAAQDQPMSEDSGSGPVTTEPEPQEDSLPNK